MIKGKFPVFRYVAFTFFTKQVCFVLWSTMQVVIRVPCLFWEFNYRSTCQQTKNVFPSLLTLKGFIAPNRMNKTGRYG